MRHFTRSIDQYMKIIKQKLYPMEKIVLDLRTCHEHIQQIRQMRTYPRNQTFAVDDLEYLVYFVQHFYYNLNQES